MLLPLTLNWMRPILQSQSPMHSSKKWQSRKKSRKNSSPCWSCCPHQFRPASGRDSRRRRRPAPPPTSSVVLLHAPYDTHPLHTPQPPPPRSSSRHPPRHTYFVVLRHTSSRHHEDVEWNQSSHMSSRRASPPTCTLPKKAHSAIRGSGACFAGAGFGTSASFISTMRDSS